MVEARVTDGRRIAQLLAAELAGRDDGGLDRVSVTDGREDAEPTPAGTPAYRVQADGEPVAAVYVHRDRARIDFLVGGAAASRAAAAVELPAEGAEPDVSVSVGSGAAVKRVVPVVQAALSDV